MSKALDLVATGLAPALPCSMSDVLLAVRNLSSLTGLVVCAHGPCTVRGLFGADLVSIRML